MEGAAASKGIIMKKLMLISACLAGVCWGSNGVFVRGLTENGFDNITIACSRALLSVLVLFIGILIYDRSFLGVVTEIWYWA